MSYALHITLEGDTISSVSEIIPDISIEANYDELRREMHADDDVAFWHWFYNHDFTGEQS